MKAGLLTLSFILMGICALSGQSRQSIQFRSGDAILDGTLLFPKKGTTLPALVVLHGSGPETRNNGLYHAKRLTKAGYVVLAYDKRGCGKSTGDEKSWQWFNFDTLAADAMAALAFLRNHPKVDSQRVGVFAGSQGGWVLPRLLNSKPSLAFAICLSCSVTTVAQDRLYERGARLKMEGFDAQARAEVREMQLLDQALSRNPSSAEVQEAFASAWVANQSKSWFPRVYHDLSLDPNPSRDPYRKWYRTVLDDDPVPLLSETDTPILWLFGDPELDRYGPVQQSSQNLQKLIGEGQDFTLRHYPGADHNLRKQNYHSDIISWLDQLAW